MITNRSLRFALGALLLLAPLATVAAQEMSDDMMGNDEGFYVRVSYGVALPAQHEIGTTTHTTEFGFLGGQLGFGYAIFGLRPEVSAGYRVAPIEDTGGKGSITSLDVIGSVYYDTDGALSLYIGVGGGISSINVKENADDDGGSAVAPAFQAAAGLGYALTEDLTVTLGYRLTGTLDTKFSNDKGNQGITLGHSAEVGIRFSF